MKIRLERKDLHRFAKYLVGGSIYFWVGYGVFAIGYSGLHWNWFWSKVLGDVVGWTSGFAGSELAMRRRSAPQTVIDWSGFAQILLED